MILDLAGKLTPLILRAATAWTLVSRTCHWAIAAAVDNSLPRRRALGWDSSHALTHVRRRIVRLYARHPADRQVFHGEAARGVRMSRETHCDIVLIRA